ncbi:MAG: hypothetical protein ACLPVY_03745 [Acidimicrobiia bacterium]
MLMRNNTKWRSFPLFLGLVAFLLVAAEPLAGAATPVPTLTSATADAGGGENVSGGGCVAHVAVQVEFDRVLLVTTTSSSTGAYSAHLVVPVSATAGPHQITILCAGPRGQITTAADVSVALPFTGIPAEREAGIALAVVALGSALALFGRRRTQGLGAGNDPDDVALDTVGA